MKKYKQAASLSFMVAMLAIFLAIGVRANAASPFSHSFKLDKTVTSWQVTEFDAAGNNIESRKLEGEQGVGVLNSNGGSAILKYTGLSDGQIPLLAVASSGGLQVSWVNDVPNSKLQLSIDGSPFAIDQSASQGEANVVVPGGSRVDISMLRFHAKSNPNTPYSTVDFSQQSVVTPSSPTAAGVASALVASTQAATSKFRQTTFIPDATVDAPASVCTPTNSYSYRFVGDNRSWSSSDSASFRTRMDVTIDWTGAGLITFSRQVGTTVRQVLNDFGTWVFDSSATAPNTSMTLAVQSNSPNSVVFRLHQDVTNPMCNGLLTNGIYADTNMVIYRTGASAGSITYLEMPNYELYLKQDSSSYSTIAKFAYLSPLCLVKLAGGLVCTTTASL